MTKKKTQPSPPQAFPQGGEEEAAAEPETLEQRMDRIEKNFQKLFDKLGIGEESEVPGEQSERPSPRQRPSSNPEYPLPKVTFT